MNLWICSHRIDQNSFVFEEMFFLIVSIFNTLDIQDRVGSIFTTGSKSQNYVKVVQQLQFLTRNKHFLFISVG